MEDTKVMNVSDGTIECFDLCSGISRGAHAVNLISRYIEQTNHTMEED
jgi:hypothetical protein